MGRELILVAGGTGFLGKRVVKKLKEQNIPHIVTSKSLGTNFMSFRQTLNFFKKNKPAVVINTAAYVGGIQFGLDHAGEIYFNNIIMMANLIEASRLTKIKKFITPISNCVYPSIVNKKLKEEDLWKGSLHESVLSYGVVRKASWVQTWAYQRQYGMRFVNFILPNMYGPGDHFNPIRSHALGGLLYKFVTAKYTNSQEVIVWGTGKPVREWLYVDDGAESLIRAISVDPGVDPINIGVGKGHTVKKLAHLIKNIVGYKGKIVYDKTKPDGAPYKVMDVTKSKKLLLWQPPTQLEEGLKKTYDWYISNHPESS